MLCFAAKCRWIVVPNNDEEELLPFSQPGLSLMPCMRRLELYNLIAFVYMLSAYRQHGVLPCVIT